MSAKAKKPSNHTQIEAMQTIKSVDMARRRLDGEKVKVLAEEYELSVRQTGYLIDKALSQALTAKLINPETPIRKAGLSEKLAEILHLYNIPTLGSLAQTHSNYLMDGDDFFNTEIAPFDRQLAVWQKELKGILDYFYVAGGNPDWYARWIGEHDPWENYCYTCQVADCETHKKYRENYCMICHISNCEKHA